MKSDDQLKTFLISYSGYIEVQAENEDAAWDKVTDQGYLDNLCVFDIKELNCEEAEAKHAVFFASGFDDVSEEEDNG